MIKYFPNRLKVPYRYILQRLEMQKRLPSVFGFEMTTRCNSLCPMCVRREVKNIENHELEFSILQKVVMEVKDWQQKKVLFNLTGLSEPTLYPYLVDAVSYIKQQIPYARVKIITNGISLVHGLSRRLIRLGLDQIMVSLNAVDRNDYISLCGVNEYETVTKNIKAFLDNRESQGLNSPTLDINLKMHEGNREVIPDTISYWKSLISNHDVVSISDILPIREGFNVLTCRSPTERYPCGHLWGEVKLDVHGNIYPCDGKVMDYRFRERSELYLGNISNLTIEDAYLSAKVSDLRRKHLDGETESLPTCAQCPVWSIFPNVWMNNKILPFLKQKWL